MFDEVAIEDATPSHHKDYKGTYHYKYEWNEREFIAWDGEGTEVRPYIRASRLLQEIYETMGKKWWDSLPEKSTNSPYNIPDDFLKTLRPKADFDFELSDFEPQPYVLLANSKGWYHASKGGLSTERCLEFLLNTADRYPKAIHVGFGLNYDIAQILVDLEERHLWRLYRSGQLRWHNYYLKWMPKRMLVISDLRVKHGRHERGRSVTLYDVFGFFQSSFIDACVDYLGKDDPRLVKIAEGKAARDSFKWDELHNFIIPYNRLELEMLVEVMNQLRTDFHNVGLDLQRWYGPGAVANQLLAKQEVQKHLDKSVPWEVSNAAQYAYAGGRFEQFQLGRYQGRVYEYDIRSAYPAAASKLPGLSEGTWHFTEDFKPGTFGIWYICYQQSGEKERRPQPLFCRSENGSVSFPTETYGWYWTPEASLVPDYIQCGYYLEPATDARPFSFIEQMYEQRRAYKAEGNPTQRALKLCLNSIYGKLAQTIGAKEKSPRWHQLEWAGYITSYTRAAIYNAIMLSPQAIIAAETDAIFSTEPLPLDIGTGLGQWECTEFKEICYLQNGLYYAVTLDDKIICRYRGLDRDRETGQPVGLPYRSVLDHLSDRRKHPERGHPPLLSSTTRFINIGLALRTDSIFRTWETTDKKLSICGSPGQSKRYHMIECEVCETHSLADCLHPMNIGGYSGYSHPHRLPWIDGVPDDDYALFLALERAELYQ